jgi:GxxExxY protein
MDYLHQDITERIIKCFYEVSNILGSGFLEKVYEHSMILELSRCGLRVRNQVPVKVHYKGEQVGDYCADIVVDDQVIIGLKAAEVVIEEHELQLINYLKATDMEVGLLLTFGKRPEVKRKIFTNDRKRIEH